MIRFGPAGNSASFREMGYRKTTQMPEYLAAMGLNAFEYQCGRGVRISQQAAEILGAEAKKHAIALSLHAPYYISLSGIDTQKRLASIDYILQAAKAVDWMGGTRIVVHAGSAAKIPREQALALAKDTLTLAQAALDQQGYAHIHICPETMGKVGQLGTLQEIMQLCLIDERMVPCIDFGHLNARSFGAIRTKQDYAAILHTIETTLGRSRLQQMHVHFSKIAYTPNGGEKHHLTFADIEYGPDYEPLMQLFCEQNLSPTVICESDGTQAEDALTMQQFCNNYG